MEVGIFRGERGKAIENKFEISPNDIQEINDGALSLHLPDIKITRLAATMNKDGMFSITIFSLYTSLSITLLRNILALLVKSQRMMGQAQSHELVRKGGFGKL
jgi:hypothetical protein